MTNGSKDSYVPGLKDLVYGNKEHNILSAQEKISRGRVARDLLYSYKEARNAGDETLVETLRLEFDNTVFQQEYFKYFGYAFLERPGDIVPNVPIVFYSFHIMVALGFLFILVQFLAWYYSFRKNLETKKWFLRLSLFVLPLAYLAQQTGWIVTEFGRQPWIIQDLMPVSIAASSASSTTVQVTFWLFAILFTALLVAEIAIMKKQIQNGPKIEEE